MMRHGPLNCWEFVATDVVRPALAVLSPVGKPQNHCHAPVTFLRNPYAGVEA